MSKCKKSLAWLVSNAARWLCPPILAFETFYTRDFLHFQSQAASACVTSSSNTVYKSAPITILLPMPIVHSQASLFITFSNSAYSLTQGLAVSLLQTFSPFIRTGQAPATLSFTQSLTISPFKRSHWGQNKGLATITFKRQLSLFSCN